MYELNEVEYIKRVSETLHPCKMSITTKSCVTDSVDSLIVSIAPYHDVFCEEGNGKIQSDTVSKV